jgi:tetratricopeptide (TPR) repeat protein
MMVTDSVSELVAEADVAYTRVVLDPARYTTSVTEIVDRARRGGDVEALVVGLRALAWAQHAVLDNAAARRLLDQAVRLATRHGLDRRLGDVLVTRAVALQELGSHAAAARDLRRAEPLVAPAQRPDLLMQNAILDHNAGRVLSAARLYRRVLADPACPPMIWVKAANNLSVAQTQLGNPTAALAHLDRAEQLARDLGPLLTAVIVNSQAWSSFHAGLFTTSIRRFEEAGRLYATAGVPLGEHYIDYADALVDLRLLDEAAAVARLAAADLDRHGARLMAAEARLRCSRLALALGDVPGARRDAESAVHDFRRQRRAAWAARATVAAVEAQASDGRWTPDALRRLGRAATTLQRLGLRANAVEAHLAAGRAALALGRTAAAHDHLLTAGALAKGQSLLVRLRGRLALALLAGTRPAIGNGGAVDVGGRSGAGSSGGPVRHCSAGLTDLARHRAALSSVELRVLAAGHGAELGELGLRSLLRTRSATAILRWLERTRAAALLTVQPSDGGVEEDVIALRSVEQQLRTARRELGAEPRELLSRQGVLEARIRRRSWGRDGVSALADDTVSPAGLRELLDGGWLVEYAAVDDQVIAVVVQPHRTVLVEAGSLAAVTRETDALLFALRRLLRGGRYAAAARTAAEAAVTALSSMLVSPLGVPPEVSLVVVPSAPFLRIPWSAVHGGPVSVAPSAMMWARSRRAAQNRPATPGTRPALVAGPGLPGAVQEIEALRSGYPAAHALLPPVSTVEATVELVRQADVAHLACHGTFRSDNPLFSALQLSDGPLTVYDMHTRGVAPYRVVLAACDSGVEKGYAGGEVLGFVSALMACGTAGVVASSVPLPDGACVALMPVLHERLRRGASLAVALSAARAALPAGGPADFVAWCGLTAYGAG